MISQMSATQLMMASNDEELLLIRIHEAVKLLKDAKLFKDGKSGDSSDVTSTNTTASPDDAPLFFQPSSTQRYYSPEPGRATTERLNIFRNVGRILGLSLLHNELCPLPLSRPVVKQVRSYSSYSEALSSPRFSSLSLFHYHFLPLLLQ